jgi:isopenicillin-N epimerase
MKRREILHYAAAAACLGLPAELAAQITKTDSPPIPSSSLYDRDPEWYWSEMRRQFLLDPNHINLNCGSLGVCPLPVIRAVVEHFFSSEAFNEPDYPWWGYGETDHIRELRDELASLMGVKRDEIAIVRNATEAMSTVCNGLDLNRGDVVVTTDQEHPGGICCWQQKEARFGIRLRQLPLPLPPASKEQIVELFDKALTPEVRAVMFSHITTTTGLILPAKEICAIARQRGILSIIDGAHSIGQVPLNLNDIGCDYYGTSPHKWLMAPKGTGVLYLREEAQDRLWVNIVSGEWNKKELKAYRFSNLGTSNLSILKGLLAAIKFHREVGPDRVFARQRQLARLVYDGYQRIPRAKLLTPDHAELWGALTTAIFADADAEKIRKGLAERKIRIGGGAPRFRISTNIFTQPKEIATFLESAAKALRA